MQRGEAETMFRVDFFEWYVLLERCLVCALGSVGVGVSSGFDPNGTRREEEGGEGAIGAAGEPDGGESGNAYRNASANGTGLGEPLIGDRRMFQYSGGYAHRFHENVLAALDTPVRNPLHGILGMGRVREYIGVAKEFRNRWKDVDENTASISGEELEVTIDRKLKRYAGILQDLNLDAMLGCILETLERARVVGEEELRKLGGEVRHDGIMGQGDVGMESDMADAPFEAGGDAMEWD
jgi:hypothetical protein